MGSLRDYLEIMRPVNSIMLGVAIIVGAFITSGPQILDNWLILLYGFLTGSSMSGAAMAINDYYDRKIDAINEPTRVIPSGRISPRSAVIFTGVLSVIGFTSSILISFEALTIAALAWLILIAYSYKGKKMGFIGNLMVGFSVALPFLYGGVISGSITAALSFSSIAFLANTGREITKGIVDIKGDRKEGVKTIAVTSGENTAARVAAIFYLSSAFTSIYPIYAGLVSSWYIPFVALTDLGLIYSSIQIVSNPSRETCRLVKNRMLHLMIIGLVGFAAGSLL